MKRVGVESLSLEQKIETLKTIKSNNCKYGGYNCEIIKTLIQHQDIRYNLLHDDDDDDY